MGLGVLFRLDPDLTLHRVLENVTIPNGISWSSDNKTIYFTDTATGGIDAYDYDEHTAAMSNKRLFFRWDGDGAPDGHCRDENDCLWVAICGGGRVLHISPEGKLLSEIHLPARYPTCPVICGEHLYITTAQMQQQADGVLGYGGSLFRCHIGVKPRQRYQFGLKEKP